MLFTPSPVTLFYSTFTTQSRQPLRPHPTYMIQRVRDRTPHLTKMRWPHQMHPGAITFIYIFSFDEVHIDSQVVSVAAPVYRQLLTRRLR